MDGFAERYITAQKSSQTLCHFLPNRSRMATTIQQQPRPASESIQPQPKAEPFVKMARASPQVRAGPHAAEAVLMPQDGGGEGYVPQRPDHPQNVPVFQSPLQLGALETMCLLRVLGPPMCTPKPLIAVIASQTFDILIFNFKIFTKRTCLFFSML